MDAGTVLDPGEKRDDESHGEDDPRCDEDLHPSRHDAGMLSRHFVAVKAPCLPEVR
jgi:hypothetical protein